MNTDAYTPVQTTQRVLVAAAAKASQPYQNVLLRNFYGGSLLGMGCMFSILATGGATQLTTEDPGLTKIIAAFVFPVGLIFIILTGAELITGNIMYMTFLLLERKVTIPQVLINWVRWAIYWLHPSDPFVGISDPRRTLSMNCRLMKSADAELDWKPNGLAVVRWNILFLWTNSNSRTIQDRNSYNR